MASQLSVTFTGLRFENPFLLASAPPTESDGNIMRAFDAGWGGVVTKTIGLHPVANVAGPKTKFLRASVDSSRLSMQKQPGTALHSSWNWELISDKPLAMTAAEAKQLLDAATKAGIVHAVTFNYRGNPLVQQARHAIARGDTTSSHGRLRLTIVRKSLRSKGFPTHPCAPISAARSAHGAGRSGAATTTGWPVPRAVAHGVPGVRSTWPSATPTRSGGRGPAVRRTPPGPS